MSSDPRTSVHLRRYKCFGDTPAGFDTIRPINVVIGRNNAGKSSLLDLIEYLVDPASTEVPTTPHAEAIVRAPIPEHNLRLVFQDSLAGGNLPGNHWEFGKRWLNSLLTWKFSGPSLKGAEVVETDPAIPQQYASARGMLERMLRATNYPTPFFGRSFRRLRSERDIRPEPHDAPIRLEPNGDGATTVIRHYLTKSHLDANLIEQTLLSALNAIMAPDTTFERLEARQKNDDSWEIYLQEKHKGKVALSSSGSGLKTLLLVLLHIHAVPAMAHKPLSDFILAFEELENNLHPSLQRRLLAYLLDIATSQNCLLFMTTHSSVALDVFSGREEVQIVHLQHDGAAAKATKTETYVTHCGILDDLDIRASDLLQANGIIWVEGPSDRLYINRWISLASNGRLREGTHYQCVFYGGRLLSHLDAADVDDVEHAVAILRVNRNAMVLMDRDKDNGTDPINATKQRIVDELQNIGGLAWVTAGREIENYLPAEILRSVVGDEIKAGPGLYEKFSAYLDSATPGKGTWFVSHKVMFAEKAVCAMQEGSMTGSADWDEKLEQVCAMVRRWNGLA